MSILDVFSKRQRRLRGQVPDVYRYDLFPNPLRVQIVHIWNDGLGGPGQYARGSLGTKAAYEFVVDALHREYGLFQLPGTPDYIQGNAYAELIGFLLNEKEVERCIDAVELAFRYIDRMTRTFQYLNRSKASERADEAIQELNERFQEHGVGYQYIDGTVIRIDSQFAHAEIVKPALSLLSRREYEGGQAEFLAAHEHFRHGRNKEALSECLKAFESVMKVICDRRGWRYESKVTSSGLLKILFDKQLLPDYLTQHFTALRSTLESGVPTIRNKLGGHGQGADVVEVPAYVVGYAIHLTAACVIFLHETDSAGR
jgi:hypothetical protein